MIIESLRKEEKKREWSISNSDEDSEVDDSPWNASSTLLDENSTVNIIPQFDSPINFEENKGLPLGPLTKNIHKTVEPKPYNRFSTHREENKNITLNLKTKNL